MSLTLLIIGFVFSLFFVLIAIMKFNIHPIIALFIGGILMGMICRMKLSDIASNMADGFGSTLGGIGIVIIWGVVLGNLLHKSGCTGQIASILLKAAGDKRAPIAVTLTGFIVAIPVFFDAAFVILINLVKSISRKGRISFVTLVTSLAVGLLIAHTMVIPTPGPLAVAENMGAGIDTFFVYGIIVAMIAAFAGGVVYAKGIGKKGSNSACYSGNDIAEDSYTSDKKPSGRLGILLIFFPIVLILMGSLIRTLSSEEQFIYQLFGFLGNKNIALLISVIVTYCVLRPYLKDKFETIITESANQCGIILLITGAGGAFGTIINATGIGDELVAGISNLAATTTALTFVLVAWLISFILRAAQGSATVALIITSSIIGPLVAKFGTVSPVLIGLAICAGGTAISFPNDSGFWVVKNFSKLTMKQTFQTWTISGAVSGAAALIVIIILTLLQDFLPGLL